LVYPTRVIILTMPESVKKSFVIFTYFVLILGTLLVFWQVRNFAFVNYDDNDYVYENPHVLNGLTWDGVIWAFTTNRSANWHPLTWLSLMLDCQLFSANPGWMHLVNLLLHLANTLLLFAVLRKMTGALWQSAFVAAAFAIHPMHVQSVAWIAERKDVLSTLFLLLTLAAYVSYVRRRGLVRYALTLLLFALGLLTKPMLVTLPVLLLLLDYWPLGRFDSHQTIKATSGQKRQSSPAHDKRRILYRAIIEKVPFFALSAISSVITFLAQRSGGAVISINALPLGYRIANAFLSYVRYIGKMFWPRNLAIFYPFDVDRFAFWQAVMCVLLLLVISIFVIRFRRKQRCLPVGWFWFVVTLIPVVGLVQSGAQAYADRYSYIPYIGLFIVIAWGLPELLSKWPQRKITLGLSMVIVLIPLGICAHRQVSYWNNNFTLFSHAIEVTQNNYLAHNNLGVAYGKLSRWQDEVEAYKQTIRIKPDYAKAHNNLGAVYYSVGRYQDAVEAYKQAIRVKPDYAEAHHNLGVTYYKLGRYQDAIESLKQVIRIKPDYAEAYSNLGLVMQAQGNYDEAIKNFSRVAQLQPYEIKPLNDIANALISSGKLNDAVEQLRRIIKMRPDTAASLNTLALLIVNHPEIKGHDANEAVRLARRACELTNYRNAVFLKTLAIVYSSAGRYSEAADTAEAVLNIDPNLVSVHKVLEVALLSGGYFKKAVVHMKRYLEIEPNDIDTKNNLAWILATSPDPNIRNPSEAIRLAQETCNVTNFKDPNALDTLAAAYASEGRFTDAVEIARTAINLADDANQPQLKNAIYERLDFYTQGKPYIDHAQESGFGRDHAPQDN